MTGKPKKPAAKKKPTTAKRPAAKAKAKAKPRAKTTAKRKSPTRKRQIHVPPAPVTYEGMAMQEPVKMGAPPKYESPEQLWNKCVEYFQDVDDNPFKEEKVFHDRGSVTRTHVSKMRSKNLRGLCLFLGIDRTTWYQYREREDLSTVCAQVDDYIYKSKLEGASAGLLVPAVIIRELGLAEITESKDPDEPPPSKITPEMDDRTAAQTYRQIVKGGS